MYVCRSRSSLHGLAVVSVVLLASCPDEAVASDLKERLLSAAPPKWAALEQYYSKLEVSFRKIIKEGANSIGGYSDPAHFDIRKNGEWMVSIQRFVRKTPDGKRRDELSVNGVNSRYAFTLGKTAPAAEAFILANFERASDKARQKVRSHGGHVLSVVYSVDTFPLSTFIKAPFASITDVRGVQRGGREMAQLSYELEREKPGGQKCIERGTVVLDPERCWCLCEWHADTAELMPTSKTDEVLEYGDDVDGFPILRRIKVTQTYREGKGKLAATWEFDKLVHRDIPESEFTLTAFGLPEVAVPGEQGQRTLWRWLIGIGVALGVGAILLRRYAKRKRQAPRRA